jgi:hypothetical protein
LFAGAISGARPTARTAAFLGERGRDGRQMRGTRAAMRAGAITVITFALGDVVGSTSNAQA